MITFCVGDCEQVSYTITTPKNRNLAITWLYNTEHNRYRNSPINFINMGHSHYTFSYTGLPALAPSFLPRERRGNDFD